MTDQPLKVLVVVARGLQLGAMGCYGNGWIDTPALDRLASQGIVFDQHFADAVSVDGAHRAWRSGMYHLPMANAAASVASLDVVDRLVGSGIPCSLVLDPSRSFSQEFVQGWSESVLVAPGEDDTPLEAAVAAAEEHLKQWRSKEKGLLWVELATPLPPWETPAEFQGPYFRDDPLEEDEDEPLDEEDESDDEEEPLTPLEDPRPGRIDCDDDTLYLRLQTTYGAAVTYLDAGIGQLLETLDELAIAGQTLVIVVSDCGQALGEHGLVGPLFPWLHEEVVHLPLLVRMPGLAQAGRRVSAQTQHVDLAPTLAEVFGMPEMPCQGHSLAPLWLGKSAKVRDYIVAGREQDGGIEWCLRTPRWAFLLPVQPHPEDADRKPQLYVKPNDRWEMNNVVQHHLEWSEALEQTLRTFVLESRQRGALQPPALPEER